MKRLSESRTYPGRECPHVLKGHCERCHDPHMLRRFRSRKIIRNPLRLHQVSVLAKENNPRPYPKEL